MARDAWRYVSLFEADCVCCVIQVEGAQASDDDPGWTSVQILSPGNRVWLRKFGTRIKRAYEALRGQPDDFLDLLTPDTTDELIDALRAARLKAWGDAESKG